MDFPGHIAEVSILLNLEKEIESFENNRYSSNILQWFKSKGCDSPAYYKNVFTNSYKFIGKNRDPNYSGPGIIVYKSQNLYKKAYIGNFQLGKRQGRGFRLVKDKLYSGYYNEDIKNGDAEIWDVSSHEPVLTFRGKFKDGVMNGECYVKDYKHKFNGMMKDGLYHGRCKIKYQNGDYFEGEMEDGEMNGQGRIMYSNGDVYEGVLRDNQITGQGKYIWKSQMMNGQDEVDDSHRHFWNN